MWKEVLCLGWQIDPRTGERYEIKSRNVKEAHHNFQKMFSRGVPVPACWEHQDIEAGDAPAGADAIAEWKRNYARYTFCHLEDSRINRRGNLEMLHPIETEEDARQLERTKFVSPKIYNGYLDSRGGEYEGTTIAHCAATPTPVQHWQVPFARELSDSEAMYLSYTLSEETPEDAKCLSYGETFSEWLDSFTMSATEPPEEPTVADEPKNDPPKKDDAGKGGGNGKKTLADVIKALKDTGMNIPDEVEDETGLVIAIKAAAGTTEPEEVEDANPDDDLAASADAATASAGGPPMVMSTLDKDPKKRARAEKEALEERKDAAKRINAAFESGRIDGPKKRALTRVATAVNMSFTATGEAAGKEWSALLSELTTAEAKPVNSAWKATGKQGANSVELSTTGVDMPAHSGAPMTKERSDLVSDIILGKRAVSDA